MYSSVNDLCTARQMILKEQNRRIVNQFEVEKFFHTEVLVKPLGISDLIYASCLRHKFGIRASSSTHPNVMKTLYRHNCLYA